MIAHLNLADNDKSLSLLYSKMIMFYKISIIKSLLIIIVCILSKLDRVNISLKAMSYQLSACSEFSLGKRAYWSFVRMFKKLAESHKRKL
ncbi:hypothetical protein H1P_300029 [Hyella patelloides LEGE 07179]|uniref:Uncharacterized protein n=1 Tax=Hyella patelloides LEGE 07179 TaxID=945734 RepID=A0A563VU90_9CYAN|nr:hypothetical protein H1P_300029 [Hyella patelloides LEGE 07179]